MRTLWLLLLSVVPVGVVLAQSSERPPRKLGVHTAAPFAAPGQSIQCTVTLLDDAGRPVPALSDTPVTVDLVNGTNSTRQALVFAGGQTSAVFTATAPASGRLRIQAQQRELLDGETIVRVQPPTAAGTPQELFVWCTPTSRTLLGDNRDPVRVTAMLNQPAIADTRLRFQNRRNTLPREPILIREGQTSVSFSYSSDRVETDLLEYKGSEPAVLFRGEYQFPIKFGPPASRLQITAEPLRINAAERTKLTVRLTDQYEAPAILDQPRVVTLSVTSRSGRVSPVSVTVAPGQCEAIAYAYPQGPGPLTVVAQSPRIRDVSVTVRAEWPFSLALLAVVGAALGAGGGWWQIARQRWNSERHHLPLPARAAIVGLGFCCGLGLYGLGIVGTRTLELPALFANAYAAFAVTAMGGWVIVQHLASRRAAAAATAAGE